MYKFPKVDDNFENSTKHFDYFSILDESREVSCLENLLDCPEDSFFADRTHKVEGVRYDHVVYCKLVGASAAANGILRRNRDVLVESVLPIFFNDDYHYEETKKPPLYSLRLLEKTMFCFNYEVEELIFMSNSWDKNYQHFLLETFPRIFHANKLFAPDMPIAVVDLNFIREILSLCFPERKFLYLKENDHVNVTGAVYTFTPFMRSFTVPAEPITIEALTLLRDKVLKVTRQLNGTLRASPKVYVDRRLDLVSDYAGARERKLRNPQDVYHLFSKHDYVPIHFDGYTLYEKAMLLQGREHIILPMGSSCMNLLFIDQACDVTIINHPVALRWDFYFIDLYRKLASPIKEIDYFEGVHTSPHEPAHAYSPFWYDTEKLKEILR